MRYEWKWDNSPSKSQFIKVNNYMWKYGLQPRALAHTKQQALTDPAKLLIQTGKPMVLSILKMRNTYELHQQTTTTKHQIPD